ncbi:MAG: prepilin-type N-terminal cleavage/methylation domain-containing protein [Terrimicrobiaceae bacterium]
MKAIRSPHSNGFTLIEVLAVLAAMAAISTIGYVAVSDTRESAEAAKLESDVASINRSVELYETSGGNMTLLTSVDTALTNLKTRDEESGILGVRGSTLDARVWYTPSSEADPVRAVWNNGTKRFEVIDSGGSGVKAFTLSDALASTDPTQASRLAVKETSTNSTWLWEHDTRNPTPEQPAFTPMSGSAVNSSLAALLSHPNLTGGAFIATTGTVSTTRVYDGAGYRGSLGVFSLEGMGNPPYDLNTSAGLLAFMREAVRRVAEGGTQGGVALDRDGNTHDVEFTTGTAVAYVLIPDDSFQNAATFLQGSNPSNTNTKYPLLSLSFATGNAAGFYQSQAVSLGHNAYAIEDMAPGTADNDYEDMIWVAEGLTEPDWSTMRDVDPNTYYLDHPYWDTPNTSNNWQTSASLQSVLQDFDIIP